MRQPLPRRSAERSAVHVGRRERHDGRGVATRRAAGRAVPRRLLPQQPAVPVRRGHRAAGGRGHPGPGAGPVRVAGRRPVVLLVHEHDGRGPGRALGRIRGRLRGRRGADRAGRGPPYRGRRARRDARPLSVRLRALFVLPAGHAGHPAAGRAAADHVHGRRTHRDGQRVRRHGSRQPARVHRQAHGRQRLRLIRRLSTLRFNISPAPRWNDYGGARG